MSVAPPKPISVRRRWIEVIALVGVWMALGRLLRGDPNAYLVLGVPLTIGFQRFLRREPLRALWVREAPAFRLGWRGGLIAAALALLPILTMLDSAAEGDPVGVLFGIASLAGAVGGAYAIRHLRRKDLPALAGCLSATLALDALLWWHFFRTGLVELVPVEGGAAARVAVGVVSFVQYMAVVYVMEEVAFRMLDGHVREAESGRGIASAVAISAIWGLWHLPIEDEFSWESLGILFYVHVPYGVCLSLFWRTSGNLTVPGLCHALGDAIRNGLTFEG